MREEKKNCQAEITLRVVGLDSFQMEPQQLALEAAGV